MPGFASRRCFYTPANSSGSSWCECCHGTCSSTAPCCASLSTACPSFGTFCQHDQLPLHGSELHIYAISLPADFCRQQLIPAITGSSASTIQEQCFCKQLASVCCCRFWVWIREFHQHSRRKLSSEHTHCPCRHNNRL